jgi:pimeloyl-ACP methyl ester carboxylesterase
MAAQAQNAADLKGWSDEQLAGITAPALSVIGDHDFVTIEHGALMKKLIPGSQLAVLPGTTHMTATKRVDLLVLLLAAFLD